MVCSKVKTSLLHGTEREICFEYKEPLSNSNNLLNRFPVPIRVKNRPQLITCLLKRILNSRSVLNKKGTYLIEIQTVSPIWVKFGMVIYFDGRKVLKMVSTLYPDPRGQGGPTIGYGVHLQPQP